ncbi:hypothetical protein HUT18_08245 [Streptomyces sp. NA04227]|uniref:protealysin inhibitor emfourin n=1 Tax=Streptomyces sp. NA04227 TaxID=2742136 RepID=UPI0015926230|nr:protealysin inhibitor emfourin [Streptomyces sp. NA04227]QKW06391.1 hypothetical protein HUT18_08245 [Streptomyces sp. NA04227]
MLIRVKRTGGFAAIEREAEIDTADRADARDWQALAEEALTAADASPPTGVPDGFSYLLTVDGHTAYCADPGLTEPQRKLISRVLKEGA